MGFGSMVFFLEAFVGPVGEPVVGGCGGDFVGPGIDQGKSRLRMFLLRDWRRFSEKEHLPQVRTVSGLIKAT